MWGRVLKSCKDFSTWCVLFLDRRPADTYLLPLCFNPYSPPLFFFFFPSTERKLQAPKEQRKLSRRNYIFLAAIKPSFPTFLLFLSLHTDIPLTFYELNCISLHEALADNLRAFYSEVLFSFQAMIYTSGRSQAAAMGLADMLQGKGERGTSLWRCLKARVLHIKISQV